MHDIYKYKFLFHETSITIRKLQFVIHKYPVKVSYFNYSIRMIMLQVLYLKHLKPSLIIIDIH